MIKTNKIKFKCIIQIKNSDIFRNNSQKDEAETVYVKRIFEQMIN